MNDEDKTPTASSHHKVLRVPDSELPPPTPFNDTDDNDDDDEAVHTPNNNANRADAQDAIIRNKSFEVKEVPHVETAAAGAGAPCDEISSMPPVQEYSVLTYDNNNNNTHHASATAAASINSSGSSGLPPRSITSKLRSPRPRSVKAVDWCPNSQVLNNSRLLSLKQFIPWCIFAPPPVMPIH